MKGPWIRLSVLVGLFLSCAVPAAAQLGATVSDWSIPSRGPGASGARTTQSDVTDALPFVGVTPCRVVDTRLAVGPFGGPALAVGSPRSFSMSEGPCSGIPQNTEALSLNITVTNTQGKGFILVYPQGGAQPLVSTLNYSGVGQTVANAAIVPAGSLAGITVAAGVHGTHLIIDINGYFSPDTNGTFTHFVLFTRSNGPALYVENDNSSCSGPCGVFSKTEGTGAWGIEGDSLAATGVNYGVYGFIFSTSNGAAGIFGTQGGHPTSLGYAPAGVRGESVSNFGVLGISRVQGVAGSFVNAANVELAWGSLGYSGYGVYAGGDIGATGTKFFVEPHPTDATKVIRYVALEGPESGTYFRGTAQTVGGRAVIDVPESFRIVTDEEGLTVQLTPLHGFASMYIDSEDLNQIVVRSSKDVTFHYLVHGVRRAFKDFQPIEDGQEFMPRTPEDRMPVYLPEEAKRRLVSNGTYNADGTVNLDTAERAGFARVWAERERAAKQSADPARMAGRPPQPITASLPQ